VLHGKLYISAFLSCPKELTTGRQAQAGQESQRCSTKPYTKKWNHTCQEHRRVSPGGDGASGIPAAAS
jgi:hypothetical protein